MTKQQLPLALKANDIAEVLQVGLNSAYDLLNSGEFHVVKIGKQKRVSRDVFLQWLNGEGAA